MKALPCQVVRSDMSVSRAGGGLLHAGDAAQVRVGDRDIHDSERGEHSLLPDGLFPLT